MIDVEGHTAHCRTANAINIDAPCLVPRPRPRHCVSLYTVAVRPMGVVLREDKRGARLRESVGLQQRRLSEVLDIRNKVRAFWSTTGSCYDNLRFHERLEDTSTRGPSNRCSPVGHS